MKAGGSGAAAASSTETVKVMVRVRPMNSKEKARGKLKVSEKLRSSLKFLIEHVLKEYKGRVVEVSLLNFICC